MDHNIYDLCDKINIIKYDYLFIMHNYFIMLFLCKDINISLYNNLLNDLTNNYESNNIIEICDTIIQNNINLIKNIFQILNNNSVTITLLTDNLLTEQV
jgi:hypothetical protein